MRCGIPQANSTTSMPRVSSPNASDHTLPCSLTIIPASSSTCCSSSILKLNSTRARRSGVVRDQLSKASRATWIASETSCAVESVTSRTTSPVAGSYTGIVSRLLLVTVFPPIKLPVIVIFSPHSVEGRSSYGPSLIVLCYNRSKMKFIFQ